MDSLAPPPSLLSCVARNSGAHSTPTTCDLGPPDHPINFVLTSQRSQMLQFCLFISTKGETQKAYAFGGGGIFHSPPTPSLFINLKMNSPRIPRGICSFYSTPPHPAPSAGSTCQPTPGPPRPAPSRGPCRLLKRLLAFSIAEQAGSQNTGLV